MLKRAESELEKVMGQKKKSSSKGKQTKRNTSKGKPVESRLYMQIKSMKAKEREKYEANDLNKKLSHLLKQETIKKIDVQNIDKSNKDISSAVTNKDSLDTSKASQNVNPFRDLTNIEQNKISHKNQYENANNMSLNKALEKIDF